MTQKIKIITSILKLKNFMIIFKTCLIITNQKFYNIPSETTFNTETLISGTKILTNWSITSTIDQKNSITWNLNFQPQQILLSNWRHRISHFPQIYMILCLIRVTPSPCGPPQPLIFRLLGCLLDWIFHKQNSS